MKKIFLTFTIFLFVSTLFSSVFAACVPNGQTCDSTTTCCSSNYSCKAGYCKPVETCANTNEACGTNLPCCSFPSEICYQSKCQTAPSACGLPNIQCCHSPNLECISGSTCINDACYGMENCGTVNNPCCVPPKTACGTGLNCIGTPGQSGAYCAIIPTPTPSIYVCGGINQSCCNATPRCNSGMECAGSNPGVCRPKASPLPTTPQPTVTTGGSGWSGGGIDFNNLKVPGFVFINEKANLGSIISALIPWAFGLAGILLLIMLILSGFQMMTSAGDPKAAMAAKGRLTGALIGFLIIFCSYWIVQIVQAILGFNTGLF